MSNTEMELNERPEAIIAKKTLAIGGIEVYVHYATNRSNPFDLHVKDAQKLKIMYLLHGRGSSSERIEEITHSILKNVYTHDAAGSELEIPVIIATFDQRNHGKRVVDEMRNQGWAKGNETHAIDMISFIEGGIQDVKLVRDYLPLYIPEISKFNSVSHIVSGISMGGHISIRAAVRFGNAFEAAAPIIGCFDLTSLLLNRLGDFNRTELYEESYDELSKSFDTTKYPRGLFDIVSKEDKLVAKDYDVKNFKSIALFGEFDPLVPMKYSLPFLKSKSVPILDNTCKPILPCQAIKYDAKHEVTDDMVKDLAKWLYFLENHHTVSTLGPRDSNIK